MATDFTKNSVSLTGGISPTTTDTPGDIRTRVETEADIMSIPKPYVGMIVYVRDTGKRYEILTLKDKKLGMSVIKNAAVDTYGELFNTEKFATKEDLAVADVELDEAQADIDALEAADIFKTDKKTSAQLGGIHAGEQLDGLSLQEVLTKLLYPYIAPVVSLSLFATSSDVVIEKGNAVTVAKLIANVERKSEAITKISFYVNDQLYLEMTEGMSEGGIIECNFDQAVVIEESVKENYFKVVVEDASNNIVEHGSKAIDIVYPVYFGVIAENELINSNIIKGMDKVIDVKGDKTYSYTSNNEHMVIAYPKEYGSLSKIVDANGFNLFAAFSAEEIEIEVENIDDEISHTYYVYKNGASTVKQYDVTFKF